VQVKEVHYGKVTTPPAMPSDDLHRRLVQLAILKHIDTFYWLFENSLSAFGAIKPSILVVLQRVLRLAIFSLFEPPIDSAGNRRIDSFKMRIGFEKRRIIESGGRKIKLTGYSSIWRRGRVVDIHWILFFDP
jgi:hypothetical protein